jgi:predicted amidohydrolase YtcJ
LIFVNGRIITLDPDLPLAEAVAIRGEWIERTGTNQEIRELATENTRVFDLEGMTVTPGFNDAHLHFQSGGFFLLEVRLDGVDSMEEIRRRVRERVHSMPAGSWIRGRGWDHTLLPGNQWPTREILDGVAPRNPVYLRRICGHIGWANSAALKAAGITRETPDPDGGEIVRDRNGDPTGILKEDAKELVSDVIPDRSQKERHHAIQAAMARVASLGITSVQEMGTDPEVLDIYKELLREGKLTVRINACPDVEEGEDHIPPEWDLTGVDPNWLKASHVKAYSDGALGAATAALLEPYSDHPDSRGIAVRTPENIQDLVCEANRAGRSMTIHAIGDRANRIVLDAYAEANRKHAFPNPRQRVEHAQVLAPEDIARFAELGVIASMQPIHCTSDMRWAEDRLGPERAKGAYAWRSVLDSGAHVAFGSDWPNDKLNPILGLHASVTRQDAEGHPAGGWHPEQRIALEEALRAYTLEPAYASFEENIKGSIEKGKLADLVVLSRPIFEVEPAELLETEVVMTIVGGRIVYERK